MTRRDPTVIYVHHMKTGGLTLRWIMQRQYEPRAVWNIKKAHGELSTIPGLDDMIGSVGGDLRAVQGHIPFGLHERLRAPCTYVTLLRDPVDRIMSLYYYSLHKHGRGLQRQGRSISLEEFAQGVWSKWGERELDNAQTRRLAGVDPELGHCTRDMLERAKENLDRHFAVVGVTERFDETLILLKRRFGWGDVLYRPRNVTVKKPSRDSHTPREIEILQSRNELDVELHRYAAGLLDEQLARQGPSFAIEVETFKRVNREYQQAGAPIGPWADRVAPAAGPPADGEAELRAALAGAYAAALIDAHRLRRSEAEVARLGSKVEGLLDRREAQGQQSAAVRKELLGKVAALERQAASDRAALHDEQARRERRIRQLEAIGLGPLKRGYGRVRARAAALLHRARR